MAGISLEIERLLKLQDKSDADNKKMLVVDEDNDEIGKDIIPSLPSATDMQVLCYNKPGTDPGDWVATSSLLIYPYDVNHGGNPVQVKIAYGGLYYPDVLITSSRGVNSASSSVHIVNNDGPRCLRLIPTTGEQNQETFTIYASNQFTLSIDAYGKIETISYPKINTEDASAGKVLTCQDSSGESKWVDLPERYMKIIKLNITGQGEATSNEILKANMAIYSVKLQILTVYNGGEIVVKTNSNPPKILMPSSMNIPTEENVYTNETPQLIGSSGEGNIILDTNGTTGNGTCVCWLLAGEIHT